MIIRPATIEDAPEIGKLHASVWKTAYRGQLPDEYLDDINIEARQKAWTQILSEAGSKTVTLVAEEGGEIIGMCNIGPARDDDTGDGIGEIRAIYVYSDSQNKGVGSNLMREGFKLLKENGFNSAIVWVLRTNINSIEFYKAKGFAVDGKEKKVEHKGVIFDEIRLSCVIN